MDNKKDEEEYLRDIKKKYIGTITHLSITIIMLILSGISFYVLLSLSDLKLIPSIGLSTGIILILFLITDYIFTRYIKRPLNHQKYQNYYNHITRLPGRMLFNDRLNQSLAQARNKNHMSSVVFLSIDKLKTISDSQGKAAVNILIKEISEKLMLCVDDEVTLGHFNEDEFAFIFPRVEQIYETASIADRILDSITRPFMIDGQEIYITGYAGIGFYPIDGNDVQTLIRNTTDALKKARAISTSNYQFCTSAMSGMVNEYRVMQNNLDRALQRGEFLLHFQPQISLKDGSIVGAEALIRWKHPALGLIIPGKFLSTAEETGIISSIGKWVLYEACRINREWQESGNPLITVSVNISPLQYIESNFVDIVDGALKSSGLSPEYLELDFPENILNDVDRAKNIFKKLHNLGVKVSLDDFGTGYISLKHIKGMNVDTIKIDRSFVNDIADSADKNSMAVSIISIGHSLRSKVLAIGVENKDQLVLLKNNNCDMIQGFYFSEPVPVEKFEILLKDEWCLKDNLVYHK